MQAMRTEIHTMGAGRQLKFQQSLDGLRSAQAQQEQQMNNGMQELKALILACHENKKPRKSDPDL